METLSPVGLPSSLQYDNLPTLPDSAFAYDVAVPPNGQNSVSVAVSGTNFYSTTTPATFPFTAQSFIFNIPCGSNTAIYSEPKETRLDGRFSITTTTAVSGGTALKAKLISSFASLFDNLKLECNSNPFETVPNFGGIYNQLLLSSVNSSERQGGLSVSMGCDFLTSSGLELTTAFATANTYYFNFSIPLICALGLNTSGQSGKSIPIGSISGLQMTITTASTLPIATYCTANPTTQPVFTVGLDQLSLNMKYINIGDIGKSLLSNSLYNGKYFIKSQSHISSTSTIPSGSYGQQQLSFQIRNTSVKSLLWYFAIAKSPICPNGYYDAINPSLIKSQIDLGGMKYPNKLMNPTFRPSETFSEYQKAFGASSLKSFGGVINRTDYNPIIPTAITGADITAVVPANYLRGGYNIVDYPHCHFEGLDLEKTNGNLLTGLNTRATPPNLDLEMSVASTSTITATMIGIIDNILVIDPVTQMITSSN